jgi:phosphoribosyl 1,2-cyclic phosphate phosphodiesterase
LAYSADIKALPAESLPLMAGLDVWIVDALRHDPHPSHMNLAESLDWIGRVAARRAVLTNLHSDLDYEALQAQIPANVEPAFDGMQLVI